MVSQYIKNPISHPEWDPSMGDFFSKRVFEEDKIHLKNLHKKRIFISSLVVAHFLLLTIVVVYFS